MRFLVIFALLLHISTAFAVSIGPIPASKKVKSGLKKFASQLTDISCQCCIDHVNALKDASKAKMTKASIAYLIKVTCLQSGTDVTICKTWIDTYFSRVIKSLELEHDPQLICSNILLCPRPNKPISTGLQRKDSNSNFPQHTGMAPTPAKELLRSRLRGNMCDYCVKIAELLKRFYMDKEAQAEVSQLIKDVICPWMSYFQSLCNIWIDNYLSELLEAMGARMNPRKFCIDSEYCPPTLSTSAVHKAHQNSWLQSLEQIALQVTGMPSYRPKSVVSLVAMATLASKHAQPVGESFCDYCVEFLSLIKNAMLDKDFVADMTHSTEQVCDILVHLRDSCVQWLSTNLPDIAAIEVSQIDPNAICVATTACKPTVEATGNKGLVKASEQQNPQVSDGICTLCQMLAKLIRDQLSNATVRAEILQFVKDKFCTILPQDKDACDQAVDSYGPIILLLLQSRIDPLSTCQMITLCPKNSTGLTFNTEVPGLTRPTGGAASGGGPPAQSTLACQICLIGFNYFQGQVRDDNATRAHVLANAESWCDVLAPPANRSACHQFLKLHFIEVMLDIDGTLLCQVTELCPKTKSIVSSMAKDSRQDGLHYAADKASSSGGGMETLPNGRRVVDPIL